MKKLYIQPETIVCEALPAQMLAGSVTGGGVADDIGYGGVDDNPEAGGDVKGDWGDIWD